MSELLIQNISLFVFFFRFLQEKEIEFINDEEEDVLIDNIP